MGGLSGGREQDGRGQVRGAIVGGQEENEESPCSADWPRIVDG